MLNKDTKCMGISLGGNICFRRWSGEQAAAYAGCGGKPLLISF